MKILQACQPKTIPITRKLSRTLEDVEYVWEHNGYTYKMLILGGYLFDGASIPWFAWSLVRLAPHGVMDGPSLPHDRGYQLKGIFPKGELFIWDDYKNKWEDCSVPMTKEDLDLLLRELCIFLKACGKRRAWEVWLAVKCFGFWAWFRDDKTRKKKELVTDQREAWKRHY